ncbi:MAG TPA: alpha/beta hydrolase, partial [Burkholderiales bacterium]|nr:alpha/beta hydrolase [Burkholderiales bacterium]
MKFILHSLAALVAGGFCFAAVAAEPPKIVMEEFMVPSKDPGIRLYLRNKHARGAKKFSGDKILLFVHGATYPAETSFDLRLNGVSW